MLVSTPLHSGLATPHMLEASGVSRMQKQKTAIKVTHRFQTQDAAARKAALTRQMARWINGAERVISMRES